MADPRQQEKMGEYFKRKASLKASQPQQSQSLQQSDSNLYQVSEQEENAEDLAIVSFVQQQNESKFSQSSKPQTSTHPPPRRPASGKRPQSSQKKPYAFNKLGDREKEQVFLNVYDENLKLKDNQKKLENHYQQLETRFKQMERYVHGTQGQPGAKKQKFQPEEDNSDLKMHNSQLEEENEKLKQKLLALSAAKQIVKQETKSKGQRKMYQSDKVDVIPKQVGVAEGQVKDLLKLNDMLKKRCLEQETQIRSLQALMNSKIVANKDLSEKNTQFVTMKERYEKLEQHLAAMRGQLEEERKRQSEIMALLRDEREKNHTLEQQVRSMELMVKSAQDLGLELSEHKRQKMELEEKLKALMESPFFKDYTERATVQAKLRTVENDLARAQQESKSLREQNVKLETENKIRKQELDKANLDLKKSYEECKELSLQLTERDKQLAPFKDLNYWDNDQFLKVLGNLKWTGEDPAWRKIEFIDRTYLDSDDPNVLRKEIEHLKLEKGELAAHLEKTQTLLKTRQDIEIEKDKLHKAEIDKLTLQLKSALAKCTELAKIADLHTQAKQQRTLYEAEGVQYDGSISEFEVDPQEDDVLQAGENYFDLYVNTAQLDSSGLVQSTQHTNAHIDPSSLLTFLTIDFYDHETQHTSVAEGINCNYNLQVSFKVTSDGAFIQYLESGYMKVELYMSQGSEAMRLATGLLALRELVYQNTKEGISRVMTGTITLNGYNNVFIGLVQFKCRMRLPISQIIRWLKDQRELDIQEDQEEDIVAVRKRKMVIVIDKASQLPSKSNTFIYYSIDNKDFNTNTQPGANPRWDYRMVHDIFYNEELVATLRRSPLEFFLIDDNMPLTADGASDKLGVAYIDLNPLLMGEVVDIASEVKNDEGERVGNLFVKIFWYEQAYDDQPSQMHSQMIQQSWEEQITMKIASEIRARQLGCQTAFRILDRDNDQIISYEDFNNGLKNILLIKMNQNEMQLYYSKLPQPLNYQSFEQVFRVHIGQETVLPGDLSQINKIVNQNTQLLQEEAVGSVDMTKQQINNILQSQIRAGRKKTELFKEIDSIKPDGYITVKELYGWLQFKGMDTNVNEIQRFVQIYMDQDRDGRINIKEFFNYFLGEEQQEAQTTIFSKKPDAYQVTLDTILEYAESNHYTLMRVREIMDSNRDGFIQRAEMKRFMRSCGVTLNDLEMNQVVDNFDRNKDNLISIQEFADALQRENDQKHINHEKASFSGVTDYMVGYLVSYMKKYNKSMPQLFNDIDQNGDGYLSREEVKTLFRTKIIVPMDGNDLNVFFEHFDADKDGRISIKEFVTIVQPALQNQGFRTEVSRKSSLKPSAGERMQVQQLQKKVEEICGQHYSALLRAFENKEDPRVKNFIGPSEFKNVLIYLNVGLTSSEIDKIITSIAETNQNGMINYVKFVDLGAKNIFDQTSQSGFGTLSQLDQDRAEQKAKQIFTRISNAIKRSKTSASAKDLFKSFDQDGNGLIEKDEMQSAFDKMKLNYTKEDLDLIFRAMDRKNRGEISIDEFLRYVDL